MNNVIIDTHQVFVEDEEYEVDSGYEEEEVITSYKPVESYA
jgi:hypothetical protein